MSSYDIMVGGTARGELLVLDQPLSLWGGLDPETGLITDVHHPQLGAELRGKIVSMAHGRGSSSASAILSEAMRQGNAPAGLILNEPDPILMIGSLVGRHLYDVECPIVVGPTPEGSGTWELNDHEVRRLDD